MSSVVFKKKPGTNLKLYAQHREFGLILERYSFINNQSIWNIVALFFSIKQ